MTDMTAIDKKDIIHRELGPPNIDAPHPTMMTNNTDPQPLNQ